MYQYQKSLDECATPRCACPPPEAVQKEEIAWRWVKNPMTDECFLPVAERNPKRFHQANSAAERCLCWGLSMYDSEANGISAFHALEKTCKKARQLIADHIAIGNVLAIHGSTTQPSGANGHFTMFSKKGVNVKSIFQLHGPIP
ncbi:hypothetical protein [Stenotrophomonas muris]|uniref:hypothetical protein n=1 Tax=Stenotrophomonas muris TaxID=2963283 RepID=UPI00383B2DF8